MARKSTANGNCSRNYLVRIWINRLTLTTTILSIAFSGIVAGAEPSGYIPGQFIVKVKSLDRLGAIRTALSDGNRLEPLLPIGMKPSLNRDDSFGRYFVYITPDSSATVADVASRLGGQNIERVEQDQYINFYSIPSDSLLPNQWYMMNSGQEYWGIQRNDGQFNDQLVYKTGLAGSDINISPTYINPPAETAKVVVAIVDTGTDPLHPELQGRFWKNPGETPGNGIDDDHNGYVDDTIGYDISGDIPAYYDIQGDNDPTDIDGHGTHLAGLVAANADGRGMVGVAPWAKIMSVKIRPNGFLSVGTAGVLYAVNAGAQIINISWGTPFEAVILREALDLARRNGVFVSIAAGNSGDNTRANPAALDFSFTVAAGNSHGTLARFSTWGPFVDIVSPGEDILSLRADSTDMYAAFGEPDVHIVGPGGKYYLADGTSMAAPIVAGSAALLLSFRPDLNLSQLESALRMGAIDIIDPLENGDSLVGPDTVSGYGYLSIERSLALLTNGGLAFVSPDRAGRYSGAIAVRAASVAGYSGGWRLEYSVGALSENWTTLGTGTSLPTDSVLYDFDEPTVNDYINFKLTDDFGSDRTVSIRYVNTDSVELVSPREGDTLRYSINISGSAFGLNYDSVEAYYRKGAGSLKRLAVGTREYFDTLIYQWNASGLTSGTYTVILRAYFNSVAVNDSAIITIASSFAAGWPQILPSRGSQTVVTADLNHDGVKELIAGTFNGLYVFESNGQIVPGFPMFTDKDMRCVPAIYDVDSDGLDDIICTNADGLHVIKYDGSYVPGWPRHCETGLLWFGYPTPTVGSIVAGQPPVIMLIDVKGKVYAYKMNGDPFFYSLGGEYTTFNFGTSTGYFWGGNAVAPADVNGDGRPEVVVSFTGLSPRTGVAVYEGRTARPAFGRSIAQVIEGQLVYGTILADLTGDRIPEIIATGQDSVYNRILWVKTRTPDGSDLLDLAGFPIRFPDASGWIGNVPAVADLDFDGQLEIVCAFYEYDIGSVYVFRADGSAYSALGPSGSTADRPEGEVFRYPNTFGTPVIADVTGDQHPEIILRGGYILPGTGPERLIVLDYQGSLLPGYPIVTPAPQSVVFSNSYAPLVDDIDGDSLVELAYLGDAGQVYVWDHDASSRGGKNFGRFMADNKNSSIFIDPNIPTDVDDGPTSLPDQFTLGQNYPNPFNPETTIPFSLPTRSQVRLEVFNVLGQRVTTLLNEPMAAGEHTIRFDGAALASGMYFYRLTVDNRQVVRKMVMVK